MRSTDVLKSLGAEVRDRRRDLQLSQEMLAMQAGLHTNVVGRLERGTYNPSVLTLFSIATKLGVSLADLFAAAAKRR